MLVSQMTDAERKIYNQGKRDERKAIYKKIADRTYGNHGTNECEKHYHITLACTERSTGFGRIMCLCDLQKLMGLTRKLK